ncbi:DUF1453 domain-containing protein [Amycolatopsis jiangsuensis]|uniref:DUF1453 domain-containing protein n=1 Tax=Amycolatopsis jiangsuensis TaxID=1181879 RepID=A0A840J288_9PSEU|nr:DUF1453 domain-containing protein [Amycolatopsis jiangsuensis]MBB4687859.1 hypothetical protein [Amycolatopsis jiangsuensis]
MSGPLEAVVIVAAIGYLLLRRLAGQPAQVKQMLVLPGVLTLIGLSDVKNVLHSPVALGFLVVTALLSAGIGALRGATIRLFDRDGVVYMRYTALTVVLLVVNVAVKFGANLLLGAIDPGQVAVLGNTLMLTLGLSMLLEGAVTMAKALRSGHRILWDKNRDGTTRTAPWVDDLQRRMATTRNHRR